METELFGFENDLFGFGKPIASPRKRAKRGQPRVFFEQSLLTDTEDCIIWPYGRTSAGYAQIRWNGEESYVYRLSCQRVYGPPPTTKHYAAHSCGKGHLGCINWKHVSWKTPGENSIDCVKHGTHHNTRLTSEDVIKIRKLKDTRIQKVIGAQFGVTENVVTKILRGVSWSWVENPDFKYNGPDLFG